MCSECPVETNQHTIRKFVKAPNDGVNEARSDAALISLAVTAPTVAALMGITMEPSDPDNGSPATLTLTLANASLLYVLGPNGYQEANG